jgi:hypothetical protein
VQIIGLHTPSVLHYTMLLYYIVNV